MGVQVDDLIVLLCDIGILTCSLLTIWCPRGDLNPTIRGFNGPTVGRHQAKRRNRWELTGTRAAPLAHDGPID